MINKAEYLQKILAEISLVLNDAYAFVSIRFFLEDVLAMSLTGNKNASEMLSRVENFHAICTNILKR